MLQPGITKAKAHLCTLPLGSIAPNQICEAELNHEKKSSTDDKRQKQLTVYGDCDGRNWDRKPPRMEDKQTQRDERNTRQYQSQGESHLVASSDSAAVRALLRSLSHSLRSEAHRQG